MDAAPERPRDETWIETARCPSRNDCQLNNDRKQAHIAEISTGCHRQLAEAAEGCKVAIIHYGGPRAPQEPGLGGLVRRAEPMRRTRSESTTASASAQTVAPESRPARRAS